MTDQTSDDAAMPATQATLDLLVTELARGRNWQLWILEGVPTAAWPDLTTGFTEPFATALLAHLQWLERLEAEGTLVLSGPVDQDMALGPALSVFRASNREEAEALVADEPMSVAGYRINTVRSWSVNEGSISLRVNLFADELLV
jgi:uncharacterized protein YciI